VPWKKLTFYNISFSFGFQILKNAGQQIQRLETNCICLYIVDAVMHMDAFMHILKFTLYAFMHIDVIVNCSSCLLFSINIKCFSSIFIFWHVFCYIYRCKIVILISYFSVFKFISVFKVIFQMFRSNMMRLSQF